MAVEVGAPIATVWAYWKLEIFMGYWVMADG
jgi:hypothetical protein